MTTVEGETVEKLIQITQIDSPIKFWYKWCDDIEQNKLIQKLDHDITEYVVELTQRNNGSLPEFDIRKDDVVVAFHTDWNKWIRGKVLKMKKSQTDDEVDSVFIWALDYGCKVLLPTSTVTLLKNPRLAYHRPINVHMGGIGGIVPASLEFDSDHMKLVLIRTKNWSEIATELFSEWICDQRKRVFIIQTTQCGRSFGQLILYCHNNDKPFCVANELCKRYEAMRAEDYLNYVDILDRSEYLLLNHELTSQTPHDHVTIDENTERIFDGDSITFDDVSDIERVSEQNGFVQTELMQNQQTSQSGATSVLNKLSLSTISVTLSVKSLNICNVLAITDDEVVPTKEWKDVFYFDDKTRIVLSQLYRNRIDLLCSYGWPHIMRRNSLLVVDDHFRSTMLCLPTICTIVERAKFNESFSFTQRVIANWTTSTRIEPIAIIFVPNAEKVERMAVKCRNFLNKTATDVNVFCLNSSFEINALLQIDTIDILITTVFCFEIITNNMPKIFTSERLLYVWFDQIDTMCQMSDANIHQTMDILVSQDIDIDIQVIATSKIYCPILIELFERIKIPMLLIGDRTPLEAALFSDCFFEIEFVTAEYKIKDLIDKLSDPHSKMIGSIIIVCANKKDVKYVTGHLTQANIKCTDFNSYFSYNQLKLVNWTEQCRRLDMHLSHPNILICEDKDLNTYPIRTATHIVHYSLPDSIDTFLQRFNTSFGYYTEKLQCELLDIPDQHELIRPISLVYFDDNLCKDFIQIYQAVTQRTSCRVPSLLIDTIDKLLLKIEEKKASKSLCIDLITKAKTCNLNCPFRHIITNENDTFIPSHGFVDMELLEVLAPNHFSVRVFAHKRKLHHKSKPVDNLDLDREQFEKTLYEYYAIDELREQPESIEVGEMYVFFYHNRPKRCRVMTVSKKNIAHIYLIDDGTTRRCTTNNLFKLNEDFIEFPSRAMEIFVLGYVPNDYNTQWLPEAKLFVKCLARSIIEKDEENAYLQAEVIKTFDRRLIVKDLKILCKVQNQLQEKLIAENLIKYQFAVKAPIKLHPIFLETQFNNENGSEKMSLTRRDSFTATEQVERMHNNTDMSAAICYETRERNTINDEHSSMSIKSIPSVGFSNDNNHIEPAAPANSIVSLIDIQVPSVSEINMEKTSNSLTTTSIPITLDEILNSTLEDHSADVLIPIKCTPSNDQTDTAMNQNGQNMEETLLIDFSDIDGYTKNHTQQGPFSFVRVIKSIDDL